MAVPCPMHSGDRPPCRKSAPRHRRLRHSTLGAFALAFSARFILAVSDAPSHPAPTVVVQNEFPQIGDTHAWAEEALPAFANGVSAIKEVAALLADHHAALVQAASEGVARLSEQKDTAAIQVAANWAEIKQSASELLGEQHINLQEAATQAAAQFSDRLAKSPAVLKAAAERLQQSSSEALAQVTQWKTQATEVASQKAAEFAEGIADGQPAVFKAAAERFQQSSSEALAQVTTWRTQATEVASQKAAQLAEGIAEKQAAFAEVASKAASHFSEQQVALRDAVSAIGGQFSERQAMLTNAASLAAAQLAQICTSCGQDALRQATESAAAQLAEHEALLRESAAFIATQLANVQATLSPSAGRIAAQLAELQQHLGALEQQHIQCNGTCPARSVNQLQLGQVAKKDVADEPALTQRPFALPYLLSARAQTQRLGLEAHLASGFLVVVALCIGSTIYTIACRGGEDTSSLAYGSFLWRVACWIVHRVFLGWALLLLSDVMAAAPMHIPKYDAMSWPMWSTLMPLSSQLGFFIPAAAILNAAVARGSRCCSSPGSRRFYASLSREVHASIVGCFLSDWLLFPTDIVFFGHHCLGLGIIFGVWSMVLGEARLLSANEAAGGEARSLTTINFWWVTGLSVASMEASSFFFNLYSVMSFGAVLNLSLFAVFTYSNLLSLMCVLAQHPWGTSIKVIWAASGWLSGVIERAEAAFPQVPIPRWLASKTTSDSVSYLWKSFMVFVICLARHQQMWSYVHEQLSSGAVAIVGVMCVLLAAASVWRLKDFEGSATV